MVKKITTAVRVERDYLQSFLGEPSTTLPTGHSVRVNDLPAGKYLDIDYVNTIMKVWAESHLSVEKVLSYESRKTEPGPIEYEGFRAVVDSSPNPMYFTSGEMLVQHSNSRYRTLLGLGEDEFVGKHILTLLDKFAKRVPPPVQDRFRSRQVEKIAAAAEGKLPASSESVLFDNRNRTDLSLDHPYYGLLRLTLNARRIRSPADGPEIAALVEYLVEPATAQDYAEIHELPPAGLTSDATLSQPVIGMSQRQEDKTKILSQPNGQGGGLGSSRARVTDFT